MDPIKVKELKLACGGDLFEPAREVVRGRPAVTGVSTDSRSLCSGDIFFALIGERFDGHAYLKRAYDAGASVLVVSRPDLAVHWGKLLPVLLVDDTLEAYQRLAAYYREHKLQQVVAVTGSVGKTSTREMIVCALKPELAVSSTKENLNNEIGVPATLLSTRGASDVLVLEMGMDHAGDLTLLSGIAKPDIAIITNIGYSHIENLGSQEAIMRAKAEILVGLRPDGNLLLWAGDPWLLRLASEEAGKRKLGFVLVEKPGRPGLESLPGDLEEELAAKLKQEGLPGPCLVAKDLSLDDGGHAHFRLGWIEQGETRVRDLPAEGLTLPIEGEHHVVNALFGLLTAQLLEGHMESALRGLSDFSVVGNRQKLVYAGGLTIMNDSYNAAPESMRAALSTLDFLAKHSGRRAVAILGGIAELGAHAEHLHRELGKWMAGLSLAAVYAYGEYTDALIEGLREALRQEGKEMVLVHCPDRESLIEAAAAGIQDKDWVLVKGSHAYRMDLVCEQLYQKKMEELD